MRQFRVRNCSLRHICWRSVGLVEFFLPSLILERRRGREYRGHWRTMDAFTRKGDSIFWKMIYEGGVEGNIEGTLISVWRFDNVIRRTLFIRLKGLIHFFICVFYFTIILDPPIYRYISFIDEEAMFGKLLVTGGQSSCVSNRDSNFFPKG